MRCGQLLPNSLFSWGLGRPTRPERVEESVVPGTGAAAESATSTASLSGGAVTLHLRTCG